jgi:hypothetical protein
LRVSLVKPGAYLSASYLFTLPKHTPPQVEAYLATSERTGEVLVVMDAKNLIPWRARWSIVTENSQVVAGSMLEDREIHPAQDQTRFTAKAGINMAQVANEYVELRFRYESIYAAEVGHPADLRREIVQRYRLKEGKVYPLP